MIIRDGFGGLLIKKSLLRNLMERNVAIKDSLSYLLDVPHTGEYVSVDKISDLLKGAIGRAESSKTLYCLTCQESELADLVLSDDPLESDIARARIGMPTAKTVSYADVLGSVLSGAPGDAFSMSGFLGIDPGNTQVMRAKRASRLSAKSGRQVV